MLRVGCNGTDTLIFWCQNLSMRLSIKSKNTSERTFRHDHSWFSELTKRFIIVSICSNHDAKV
jgi:hypothetical protein